jgi:hypothetical protein
MANRTLAIALALTLAISVEALAAGPLKGKTYRGQTATSGVNSENYRLRLSGGGIILVVAANGRSVTVRFASPAPLLYCKIKETVHSQGTKAAAISSGGEFRATIAERFTAGTSEPSVVQVVTGQFSGHTVNGKIHTEAGECSGTTTFSATAP